MKNINNIRHEETLGVCGDLPETATMTECEIDRIKTKTLGMITPRRNKPRRFAAAAVAIVCMFTLIACSAEIFHWNYRLSALLNLGDEQKTYAEKNQLTQNVEKPISAECSGLKITLRQTIADSNLCYLIFDAELPENLGYLAEGVDFVDELQLDGLTYCARPQTLTLPQDMSAENNTVSFYVIGFFKEDSPDTDIPVSVVFKNFTYRTFSKVVTTEGLWSLSCKIGKNGKTIGGAVDIPYETPTNIDTPETGRIVSYSFSPLSLTLEYIPDRPDPEASCFVYDSTITIRYKDGKEVPARSINVETDNMGGYYDREREAEVNYLTLCLDQLINIEEVSEIIYNGSTIPVNQ